MKTETQVFRGYGKRKELTSQTAVECRFTEVENVLTVHAHAILTGADAANGEVRFYGKAHFSVVYEDADKHICRAEKGVEFSAVCKDGEVSPALTARACVSVENVSVRREGASVYATALLGADIALYGEQSFEYLSGGDLICKREPVKAICAHLCGGVSETEDEFETESLGDILQHTETVCLSDILCETGVLKAEGEINLGILALKGDDLVSFERLVPFTVEIPCDAAVFGCRAEAKVSVANASLKADEDGGRCRITAEFTLSADGCVYEETDVDGVLDCYSLESELAVAYYEENFTGAGETHLVTERVSGKAALSGELGFSDSLQAVTLQRAEGEYVMTPEGGKVEGVAMATLLVKNGDGVRGIEMSLPFSVAAGAKPCDVSVMVCGMSARQKQEGEIDAEATLKIFLHEKKKLTARLVSAAVEGERLPVNDSAVSVYIPRAGDGLWELAKKLKKPPEEVAASNPDIEFPVRAGQRVIVYRKKQL